MSDDADAIEAEAEADLEAQDDADREAAYQARRDTDTARLRTYALIVGKLLQVREDTRFGGVLSEPAADAVDAAIQRAIVAACLGIEAIAQGDP